MAVSKAESPHSIISFFGVWKILSEFFIAHGKHWAESHRDHIPLFILRCLIHTILQTLSQQGEFYGTAEELSFLLQSHLLFFRPHLSWFVRTVATCEGMSLGDHTPQGSDFHPSWTPWCANAEIWSRNVRIFWRGGNDWCTREIWLSQGWCLGCGMSRPP